MKHGNGQGVMLMITRRQCDEIIHLVSKYCCCHCSGAYCSETDCDIQDIYEILNRNVEKESVNEEDEKLPFKMDDEELS